VILHVLVDWSAVEVRPAALVLVTWPLLVWAAFGDGRGARPDGGTVRRTRLVGAAGAATLLLAVTVAWLTHSAVVGRYTAVVVPLALLLLASGRPGCRGPRRRSW